MFGLFGLSFLELAATGVAVGLGTFLWKLVTVRRSLKGLPQPPGHSFLWGHTKTIGEVTALFPPKTHPQLIYTELAKRYNLGDVWYVDVWPFFAPIMVITSADGAMQISAIKPYPRHDWVNDLLGLFFGPNVIAGVNGPMWKRIHHMLGPSFSPAAVKGQVPSMVEHVAVYHDKLKEFAESGKEFAMQDVTSRAIFDVVSATVLGFSLRAQRDGSPLLEDLALLFTLAPEYLRAMDPITKMVLSWKMRGPRLRTDKMIRERLVARHAAILGGEEKGLLAREMRAKLSVMDRMIVQWIEEVGEDKAKVLDKAFLRDMISNLKGLLGGGQGTTSDTVCFTYMLLSLHPDIMQRLRDEHDRMFPPDYDGTIRMLLENPFKTNELEYTAAVVKETLRLFPIGFTSRQAPDGVDTLTLEGKDYPLKNQMVVLLQHASHYNPEYFPDPDRFLPDRFLESYEPKAHRYAWRPFERGPRSCMGQELATDEMRVMLLLTARWFDFETVLGEVPKPEDVKVTFTKLAERVGILAYPTQTLSAAPRLGMPMKVRLTGRA